MRIFGLILVLVLCEGIQRSSRALCPTVGRNWARISPDATLLRGAVTARGTRSGAGLPSWSSLRFKVSEDDDIDEDSGAVEFEGMDRVSLMVKASQGVLPLLGQYQSMIAHAIQTRV